MDKIAFLPQSSWFPKSTWWITVDYTGKSWLLKVPFSFLSNGWHLCKGIQTYSYLIPFTYLCYGHLNGLLFLLNVVPYCLGGIVWQIFYGL
jgi:hypothetical protein